MLCHPVLPGLLALCALASFDCTNRSAQADNRAIAQFPRYARVSCTNSVLGCHCLLEPPLAADRAAGGGANPGERVKAAEPAGGATPAPAVLFHAQSVELLEESGSFFRVRHLGGKCYYPSRQLQELTYARVPLSKELQRLDHSLLPLSRLVKAQPGKMTTFDRSGTPQGFRLVATGPVWPTYYHLALEEYFPGPMVSIRSARGKSLGSASQAFLEQTKWQGSGIAKDGRRLHYVGRGLRFELYPPRIWGYGAGHGHVVHPYRTIAVNFRGMCRRLRAYSPTFRGRCGKAEVIGLMVRIPEVVRREILMPNGAKHDGWFCATDTGAPAYIRADRIDIFVGVHGGGNPFLPPPRRSNALIDGGIATLVPSDWRLWKTDEQRVFCPTNRLPAGPSAPLGRSGRECLHDYHHVARHKALELQVALDPKGVPLRCRRGPYN